MSRGVLIAIPLAVGIAVGVLLAGYDQQANPDPDASSKITASNLKSGGSPVRGDFEAPVTILEYGDYQCTFCYRFHQTTLNALQEKYVDTGMANMVFKDFALNGPDSILAAKASHCAGDQGRYWEYHDELYGNWGGERTGWVTRDSLDGFAGAVGLKLAEFNDCLDRQKHRDAVLGMYRAGQEIGVDATPSFFIFSDERVVKIRGNQPLEVFEKTIDGL